MKDNLTPGERLWWEVQKAVYRLLADRTHLDVLEAGCGSTVHFAFPAPCHTTGIDVSERQLERHEFLKERILGDLQTYELPADSFDAIVCWNVLEHLTDPVSAVRHMFTALRPGGILILAYPNPLSFKGLGARLTPHRFHEWFYKTILGIREAGADDVGPFPTVMRLSIAPDRLCKLAGSCGLEVELKMVSRGGGWYGKGLLVHRALEWALIALAAPLRILTLGKFRGDLAETRLIFRRPAVGSESRVQT